MNPKVLFVLMLFFCIAIVAYFLLSKDKEKDYLQNLDKSEITNVNTGGVQLKDVTNFFGGIFGGAAKAAISTTKKD